MAHHSGKGAAVAALTLMLAAGTAVAGELVVAHIGPFSGPLSHNGLSNLAGAKACVAEANAAHGVNGNTLRIVDYDDGYKPQKTIALMREVAVRDKPVAFINVLGSANVTAMLKDKTLEDLKIPLVGVTPAADSLRSPGSPWIFHTTASDNAQLGRIVQHLSTLGMRRIAVAFQDLPFGRGGLAFIEDAAQKLSLTVTESASVPAGGEEFGASLEALRKADAQAYVMVLAPNTAAAFAAQVRKTGDLTPLYGMSYVPVKGLVERAGSANAVGIALAQVTPNTSSSVSGLSRKFHVAMDKFAPGEEQTQHHLIGYLNCRVLLEGLRGAGDNPTPERLRQALQRVRTDFGGYPVDFAGGNAGSRYVNIGVVTRDGKLMY